MEQSIEFSPALARSDSPLSVYWQQRKREMEQRRREADQRSREQAKLLAAARQCDVDDEGGDGSGRGSGGDAHTPPLTASTAPPVTRQGPVTPESVAVAALLKTCAALQVPDKAGRPPVSSDALSRLNKGLSAVAETTQRMSRFQTRSDWAKDMLFAEAARGLRYKAYLVEDLQADPRYKTRPFPLERQHFADVVDYDNVDMDDVNRTSILLGKFRNDLLTIFKFYSKSAQHAKTGSGVSGVGGVGAERKTVEERAMERGQASSGATTNMTTTYTLTNSEFWRFVRDIKLMLVHMALIDVVFARVCGGNNRDVTATAADSGSSSASSGKVTVDSKAATVKEMPGQRIKHASRDFSADDRVHSSSSSELRDAPEVGADDASGGGGGGGDGGGDNGGDVTAASLVVAVAKDADPAKRDQWAAEHTSNTHQAMRFEEFMEAIVRLALLKYADKDKWTLFEKTKGLIVDFVLPNAKKIAHSNAEYIRALEGPVVAEVFVTHASLLRAIFKKYASVDQHFMLMPASAFLKFCDDYKILKTITMRSISIQMEHVRSSDVHLPLMPHDDSDAQREQIQATGANKELSYREFCELVCSLACFANRNPYMSVAAKLQDFILTQLVTWHKK